MPTGRLWVYVRDDRPVGGQGPPAALYDYSPSRHGEYPRKVLAAWSGIMQADAFSGYNALYAGGRETQIAWSLLTSDSVYDGRAT